MIAAFCALVLVAAESLGRFGRRTLRTPRLPAWSWIAVLLVTYAAQLGIVLYAARHQFPTAAWRATMPLAVVDDRGLATEHGDAVTVAMLAFAALQTYCLLALYRERVSPLLCCTGCALMLVLSLCAPALLSFDLYGYVHDALLGRMAWMPPHVAFSGEYRVFDQWFGQPSATIYGPLWLALIRIVTAAGTTLFGKLMAWRVFCALLYLVLLGGLRALRVPPRMLLVTALNPGMMLEFVANAHNDLVALVLIVFAAVLVRDRVVPALGLLVVAGLVKLPYAVLGLPVLAAVAPLRLRTIYAATVLAAIALLSLAGGGAAYVHSLTAHVGSTPENLAHRIAGFVAIALIASTLFGMRRLRSAVWTMPMIGAFTYAWYFIWGFPYALSRRRILAYLLIAFPFVAILMETAFERTWEIVAVIPLVVALSILPARDRVTSAT